MKTKDLKDLALDYAAALIDGWTLTSDGIQPLIEQGRLLITLRDYHRRVADDIIDREGITVIRCDDEYGTDAQGFTTQQRIPVWAATTGQVRVQESTEGQSHWPMYQIDESYVVYGATRREAAMRAFVRQVLGSVIEIPKELL